MLQGVNIFLISHPTVVHLKCQIGPELSVSSMYDIELIRPIEPVCCFDYGRAGEHSA